MSRFIGEQMHRVKKTINVLNIRQSNDSPDNTVTGIYGFFEFEANQPDNRKRPSQYIRLALKTDPETVVRFMRDGWHLPTPDLIISVTGGAKHFDLSARLRKVFQLGLFSAAATTNAWIITAGTNAGVVKEVGGALDKYRYKNQKDGLDIPCIGIASWGYTAGKEQLDRPLSNTTVYSTDSNENTTARKFGHRFGIDALQMTGEAAFAIRNYRIKEAEEKKCDLEPNHTHFLLFDDGTSKSENVLPLRADIEMCARRTHIRKTSTGNAIETLTPVVMVLLEGGRSAIRCICEALDSNTPVVVVKDSGRGADLVADLHRIFSKTLIETTADNDEDKDDRLSSRRSSFAEASLRVSEINAVFTKARVQNPWVDDIREDLCRAINGRRQLVTIFNFNSGEHIEKLEDAILQAVFNAAKYSHNSNEEHRSAAELRLALAWHSVVYARKAIFNDSTMSKWTEEDRHLGLVDALRRGHIDFIELFIEYGITLEKLTVDDLEYLYSTASIDKILPLKKIKRSLPKRDEFYADYLRNRLDACNNKNLPLGENAPRDLFFWAIFLDRFDFAVYLCSKTWNQSVALIFGARIYQKAAIMTLDSETKHQYESNAGKLDKYAASIIDRCFDIHRDFAVNLLRQPAVAFYHIDPLKLALKANCRAFLASKCVQKHLDNEWFGNINYKRQNINIRVFLCSLFFPLLPFFCGTLPYLRRHHSVNPNIIYRSKNSTVNTTYSYANSNVRWTEKIVYFYRAPIVKFYYNLIFFFIFLGLFSFVLLIDFFPLNTNHGFRSGIYDLPIPIPEICLHICVLGIIIEELRQFFLMNSYYTYLNELSNLIDLTAIILYLIGFITRFIVKEEFFMISKICFGIDLILWYVRILHLFAAYEKLGPKLIMIFNTMKDLLFFVCFILIFLFGFSITSWSLITTSAQVKWIYNENGVLSNITISDNGTHLLSWKLLRDVTNYGVWKVFGQVDLVETNNSYSAVAFVLAILFVTISNVLLLNVLVALFNVTIANVQDESHDLWRYQRFLIVNEFRHKSLLPPPFNTFSCLFSGILHFITRQRKRYRNHTSVPTEKLEIDVINTTDHSIDREFQITDSMQRESAIAEDFWREILHSIEEKSNR